MSNPPPYPTLAMTRRDALQREHTALLRVRDLSNDLLSFLSELDVRFEEMNSGYDAVAKVIDNWQGVFRSMSIIDGASREGAGEAGEREEVLHLVRIPAQPSTKE